MKSKNISVVFLESSLWSWSYNNDYFIIIQYLIIIIIINNDNNNDNIVHTRFFHDLS